MRTWITLAIVSTSAAATLFAAPAPDSPRLARAKEYIADEQWSRAVAELRALVDDTNEKSRDEAMYWLAESEHETGDQASAIQTIVRLEREFPSSRWVHPARSLMVEIAHRMGRDDLLWVMAVPPPAPSVPPAPMTAPAQAPPPPAGTLGPMPHIVAHPAPTPAPTAVPPTPAAAPILPTPWPMPQPAAAAGSWGASRLDTDLQIEALGGLIDDHPARVIPLLKDIALDRSQPNQARRAVFVLGQSSQPEARQTILEVARKGAGTARLAAVRELGQFKGPAISGELMQVYAQADSPLLKRQVVASLGERADTSALMHIATTEHDAAVRDTAILTLGRASARAELRTLYVRSDAAARPVVLSALFNAKDDDGLIQIARTEQDPTLRLRAIQQLRILGTPKAVVFLSSRR